MMKWWLGWMPLLRRPDGNRSDLSEEGGVFSARQVVKINLSPFFFRFLPERRLREVAQPF